MISRIIRFLQSLGLWSKNESLGRRFSTTRYAMYNSIENFIQTNNIGGKVLIISEGKEHSIRNMFLTKSDFTSTSYPDVNIMDLRRFLPNSFDVVVTDQVLEHTPNPFIASKQIHRILRKGGWAINTSCTFNPIHDLVDYFRFTKDGFKEIHKPFKKIALLETWGNREAIGKFVTKHYKSFDVRRNQRDLLLSTKNDSTWPWSVWCIAQK